MLQYFQLFGQCQWQFESWRYVQIILLILFGLAFFWGCFHGSSAGEESTCNVGDLGLIPGLGRSPGEGKGYPVRYSGLENSIDYTVHGVAKSQTQLSDFHFLFFDMIRIAWASLIAQLVKNLLQCRRPQFNSWVKKITWRRDRLLVHLSILGLPLWLSW